MRVVYSIGEAIDTPWGVARIFRVPYRKEDEDFYLALCPSSSNPIARVLRGEGIKWAETSLAMARYPSMPKPDSQQPSWWVWAGKIRDILREDASK